MLRNVIKSLVNLPFYGKWVYSPHLVKVRPYLELMRLQHPAGIYFLLIPCLLSIALASKDQFHFLVIFYFIIGSVFMRAAGCIINDILDRDIDKYVERTKNRPIASGVISVKKASLFLCLLLLVSAFILLQLNVVTQLLGIVILIPVFMYPLMKRFTNWPQLFLGITINWGALMGWAAVTGTIELPALLLYLGAITWTLAYDTIYAHQDVKDDVLIGVKSTAINLGEHAYSAIRLFYIMTCTFWLFAISIAGITNNLFFFLAGCLVLLTRSILINTNLEDTDSCMNSFKLNAWIGVLSVFIIMVSR